MPELQHQYLWRFWLTLPRDGHIAIYDRSWYGRVLVERVRGRGNVTLAVRRLTESRVVQLSAPPEAADKK